MSSPSVGGGPVGAYRCPVQHRCPPDPCRLGSKRPRGYVTIGPMAINPHAGRPAEPSMLVDVDAPRSAPTTRSSPTRRIPRSAWPSALPAIAAPRSTGAFNEAHILAINQAICRYRTAQGIDGPAVPRTRHARAVGAGAGTRARGAGGQRRRRASRRRRVHARRPVISHAILATTAGATTRPGRRHRRHALAQPARRRRLQVQPAQRRTCRHRRHRAGSRTRRTRLLEAGLDGVRRASRTSRRCARDDAPARLPGRYVGDLANVVDMDAIRGSGLRLGVDPLGGAGVHYWAADRRALRARSDGRQRRRRSHVRVHDPATGTARSAWTRRRRTRCGA